MAVTFAGQTLSVGPGILGSNQSLALACWVNITSRAGFSQFIAVNHTGNGTTTFDGQDLLACDDTTGPTLDVYGGSYSQSTFRTIDITTWGLGEWHHLAMTYNATNGDVFVYFDGVANAVSGAALPTRGAITDINIGPFNGQIQDVHVWSANIASVQIQPLVRRRRWIGGGGTGLTLLENWYPFFAPDTALSDFTGKNRTLTGTTPAASTSSPAASWGGSNPQVFPPVAGGVATAGTGGQTSGATVALVNALTLAGTGGSTAGASAAVTVTQPTAGTGGSVSGASATMTLAQAIVGSGLQTSGASVTLGLGNAIAGTGGQTSGASADMTLLLALSGTGGNASGASVTLTNQGFIGGTGNVSSGAAANLTVSQPVLGTGGQTSGASVGVVVAVPIATTGTGGNVAGASVSITGGTPPPPVGGTGSSGWTGKRRRMFIIMSRGRQR